MIDRSKEKWQIRRADGSTKVFVVLGKPRQAGDGFAHPILICHDDDHPSDDGTQSEMLEDEHYCFENALGWTLLP